jgi:hypothetical protein
VTGTWPDGSIKWTAHAFASKADGITVAPGKSPAPVDRVSVARTADGVVVTCGGVAWDFAASGPAVIRGASMGGARFWPADAGGASARRA